MKKKNPTKPSFAAVMCGEHWKKSKKTPLSCVLSEGGGSGAAGEWRNDPLTHVSSEGGRE